MEVPDECVTQVSCPSCSWADKTIVKKHQWDSPDIYIWLTEMSTRHRRANPYCSVTTDDLRIKALPHERAVTC